MSYSSISRNTRDGPFLDRLLAAIAKETYANPTFGDTVIGQIVKLQGPQQVIGRFVWPIAIDNELAYEFAVGNENPDPGGDPGVITDGSIGSGVQAHWPSD